MIAIIAILVALLLPAVQQVREAARKSQCQDHLHNLAIGFHSYEGTHKTYPPAWVQVTGSTPVSCASNNNWGWGTYLMPFIEQKPLYDALNPAGPTGPCGLHASGALINGELLMRAPLDLFRCPSDSGDDINHFFDQYATSNYIPSEDIAFANSRIRVRDILDGTSNTFLLAERQLRREPAGKRNTGAIVFGRQANSTASAHFRATNRINTFSPVTSNTNAATGDPDCVRYVVSSLHPGGAQVVMGDAKVTFLSENIDTNPAAAIGCTQVTMALTGFVYQNLFKRDDGNPVKVP